MKKKIIILFVLFIVLILLQGLSTTRRNYFNIEHETNNDLKLTF